ncbi:monocarboxylate transporter 12 [Plakobranchus ocellatus]|uniref:Monocarboxylate transporter 12 n=1 Tax=Plakobranchus ocellatus TaxID=259542 RepID=A0AAV3XUK0_9GAST|nr:monocarboxylate transporter 12 [Plakobranchus ocellatus]
MTFFNPFVRELIFILLQLSVSDADLFNFQVTETSQNVSRGEELCRDSGYDGLAIVNFPEAYSFALRILSPLASRNDSYLPAFVGVRSYEGTGEIMWDDRTAPASDEHFSGQQNGQKTRVGRITNTGGIKLTSRESLRHALCGDRKS